MSIDDFGKEFEPFVYGEYQWDYIPTGTYEVTLFTWYTYTFINKKKVVFIFCINEFGEFYGRYIPAFFEVNKHLNKPQHRGKFKSKTTGYLIKAFRRMLPELPRRQRLDRLPTTKLLNHIYQVEVVDVTKDSEGVKYENSERYSKVNKYHINRI